MHSCHRQKIPLVTSFTVRFVAYYAWPIGMAVVVYTTTTSYTKRMQVQCVGCGFTTKVSAGVSRSTWKDNS